MTDDGLDFYETFVGDGGQPFKITGILVPTRAHAPPTPEFSTTSTGSQVDSLTWKFNGWQMAPCSTLTIEIQAQLAPGVTEGQAIENSMGATSPTSGLVCAAGDKSLGWWNERSQEQVAVGAASCPSATFNGRQYTAFPCVALLNPSATNVAGTDRARGGKVGATGGAMSDRAMRDDLLVGLLFKAGGMPDHFWVPDATEGASVTAAAFLTTVPKIDALVAITRLVAVLPGEVRWAPTPGLLAVASMTIGNLAAQTQTDVRRLLGWSTVSQVGYLLAAAAVTQISDPGQSALLFFLAGYAVTNLAAFAVVAAAPDRRSIVQWKGFASTRPGVTAALVVALLGVVGTPPAAVFVGKLTTMAATWDAGLAWLASAIALNSVLSLFYYLRWFRAALQPAARGDEVSTTGDDGPSARMVSLTAATATVVMGLAAGPIFHPRLTGVTCSRAVLTTDSSRRSSSRLHRGRCCDSGSSRTRGCRPAGQPPTVTSA